VGSGRGRLPDPGPAGGPVVPGSCLRPAAPGNPRPGPDPGTGTLAGHAHARDGRGDGRDAGLRGVRGPRRAGRAGGPRPASRQMGAAASRGAGQRDAGPWPRAVVPDRRRRGGRRRLRQAGRRGEAGRIAQAFRLPLRYDEVRTAGFDDDAGFCEDCGVPYCARHWHVSQTGYGTCPLGHGKSLDPHWQPAEDDCAVPGDDDQQLPAAGSADPE
jgi:hypothetical protein